MQDSPTGCLWCGQPFAASRADARYCSDSHRVSASRARHRDQHALSALDAARSSIGRALGAEGEQRLAAIGAGPLAGIAALIDAALTDVRSSFAHSTGSGAAGNPRTYPPR